MDMLRKTLMMALAAPGVVLADAVHHSPDGESVVIKFDEPVVPLSVVNNAHHEKAGAEEKGLNLFDLTGCEAECLPEVRWLDQDRLQLTYRPGFAGDTVFRVAFRPGADKYLSGAKMPQSVFEFQCNPKTPQLMEVNPGMPRAATCVYVPRPLTKAQLAFSHTTPVRYEFREVVNEKLMPLDSKRYGRRVPGVSSPAQVRHLPARQVLQWVCGDGKSAGEKITPEAMTPESAVPGHVLVQPAEDLPGANEWVLAVVPEEGTDLKEGFPEQVNNATPLCMVVANGMEGDAGKETQRLRFAFNALVLKSDLPDIFRKLEMKVGDAVACNAEDGKSKTLTLPNGKTLVFTYCEPKRQLVSHLTRPRYNRHGQPDSEKTYSYNPPYTTEMEVEVSGTAAYPQLLDVCLPAGTRAMLGAENKEPVRMRLNLSPAWPLLGARNGGVDDVLLLPLVGDHKLRVAACNLSAVQVSAARFTPEQFLEYTETLGKVQFGALSEYREALYDLALLRTRKHIPGMKVSRNNITSAERRVKNVRRWLPNLAALRTELKGVNFTAPQQVAVQAAAVPGLSRGEAVVELDALMGGKAAPGFYIVSVVTTPTADVQEQLRSVGADPADFVCEQWFPVLLSNLNVVSGNGAVAATRLSDGAPVAQGQVLLQDHDPVPLQHAVAVVPRPRNERSRRYQRWLILQSGEDYRPIRWRDEAVRMGNDCRMEIVRDRGTYRPGETVHMRGVLREVSPLGVASLPKERNVIFTVNRPDGNRMIDKTLRVNEYGAFEVDFVLPDGEEDVTGNYRVQARCGDFRAYSYVSCEVFRRDAFKVETELTMQPIRPGEYSVKVTATDLNGTPLSGAKLALQTRVEQGRKLGSEVSQTHQLTLGTDGTATYTAKLPQLSPEDVVNSVSIGGEVRNDREEVLRLPGKSQAFYPADFTAALENGDTLMLRKVVAPGEKGGVLERTQTVHLRLSSRLPREHEFPNGIVVQDTVPQTLWEGDVTVPANAVNGVPTGLLEHWQRFADSLNKGSERHANPPMVVELTATDAAGRKLAQNLYAYRPWRDRVDRRPARGELVNGCVKLSAPFAHGGQGIVVLRSVQGTRALPVVQLREGENELSLPLAEGEVGNVQVSIMLPTSAKGLYTELETAGLHVNVPHTAATLKVALELPQEAARPGQKLTLAGTVTGPDGKPAEAQVTLFAVDAGMLSVDQHRVPNLLEEFTRVWVDAYNPRVLSLPSAAALAQPITPRWMPGIWSGQWLDAQGRIIEQNGFMRYASGVIMSSSAVMGSRVRKNRAFVARAEDDGVECEMASVEMSAPAVSNAMDCAMEECAEPMSMERGRVPAPQMAAKGTATGGSAVAAPRLRTNFVPVAVWCPALATDANGRFATEVTLPDTLTSYKVFALALGKTGSTFGNGEGEFTVNQPVMLTPGTPLFMSTGDCLRLPLTITNATDKEASWVVMLEGARSLQKVSLKPKSTATLYFDYTAEAEGERTLRWKAVSPVGGDAVEGRFPVRFPAPVLKEAHHLVLSEGKEALKVATLLAPELAGSTRGELEILLSANPLLHLYGCMELVQNTPYPCTQYNATSLLVWMLYDRLAPFSPIMAQTEPAAARRYVTTGIAELLKCQQQDGGISFWCGARQSSPWASAYVGLVLTLAGEQGFDVPADAMARLKDYLRKQLALSREKNPKVSFSPFDLYAIGRTIGDRKTADDALAVALKSAEKNSAEAAIFAPVQTCCWWRTSYAVASLRFLAEMSRDKTDIHADFLKWMRAVGHDYRHATHWDGGWMLLALHEYLRRTPGSNAQATLTLQDGQQLTLGQGMTTISPAAVTTLGQIPTTLTPVAGTAYLTVKAKALPEKTDYPGVTEKGLQITR
ncbi:MAG: MG2 domain-containing protein, partial [Akkermansia sp.]|nr:MG2 domain-containing protein [Akkermansia sp.]